MTDTIHDIEPGPPIDWRRVATSHMRHIRELAAERDAAEARVERLRRAVLADWEYLIDGADRSPDAIETYWAGILHPGDLTDAPEETGVVDG